MNPGRKLSRAAKKAAKYAIPVSEHAKGASKRLTKSGALKKGFKYAGGRNEGATSNRIPYSTLAIAPKPAPRRAVVGGERGGKAMSIVKRRAK